MFDVKHASCEREHRDGPGCRSLLGACRGKYLLLFGNDLSTEPFGSLRG